MRKLLLFTLLFSGYLAKGQTGYDCQHPIALTAIHQACSDDAQYNNTMPQQGGITWFKFVPDNTVADIAVNGNGAGGTLQQPVIALRDNCTGADIAGLSSYNGDVTTFHAEGLTPGATYYIAVSSSNNQNGTFKLCIDNPDANVDAADCDKAIYIASTSISYCHGPGNAGTNANDGDATCLGPNLQHKVWYKWQASNTGALAFKLTPQSAQGHINFALYDLGTSGDCANANPGNLLRCLAGYGDDVCAGSVAYSSVGLSGLATDVSEQRTCGMGQDGKLKFIEQQKDHIYALLINEDLSTDPGFCLKFGFDPDDEPPGVGVIGSVQSPPPGIAYVSAHPGCTSETNYIFTSTALSYHKVRWDFGPGAIITGVDAGHNYHVHYNTTGLKTITLYGTDDAGNTFQSSTSFTIDEPSVIVQPVIMISNNNRCTGDVVELSTTPVAGLNYIWTGPNNFTSTLTDISINIADPNNAGVYTLTPYDNFCPGPTASVKVPAVGDRPVANFTTSPAMPSVVISPAAIQFSNLSVNADSYAWDFGDGGTSTLTNPTHIYLKDGTYSITLTAFQEDLLCSSTIIKGAFTVRNDLTVFVPNTFTPNSDGINDAFTLNASNIQTFHMMIYNRWGAPVFETSNIDQKWTGNYNGKPLPAATYYYMLSAVSYGGTVVNRKGYILLIR